MAVWSKAPRPSSPQRPSIAEQCRPCPSSRRQRPRTVAPGSRQRQHQRRRRAPPPEGREVSGRLRGSPSTRWPRSRPGAPSAGSRTAPRGVGVRARSWPVRAPAAGRARACLPVHLRQRILSLRLSSVLRPGYPQRVATTAGHPAPVGAGSAGGFVGRDLATLNPGDQLAATAKRDHQLLHASRGGPQPDRDPAQRFLARGRRTSARSGRASGLGHGSGASECRHRSSCSRWATCVPARRLVRNATRPPRMVWRLIVSVTAVNVELDWTTPRWQ